MEVIGKQNRKVPILIPPETNMALEALISTRGHVGIDARNPFMFPKVVKVVYCYVTVNRRFIVFL